MRTFHKIADWFSKAFIAAIGVFVCLAGAYTVIVLISANLPSM